MITKRPNGYRIDFRDATGRRFRKSFSTKKAAETALDRVKTQIREGEFLSPKTTPTFNEIATQWLASKCDRRPATVDLYRNHVETLLPRLGDVRLDRIDVLMVERIRDELRARKYAPRTIASLMTSMSAIFKLAVCHKHIRISPAAAAERPYHGAREMTDAESQNGREGEAAVTPDEVLNSEEIRHLIAAAAPGYYRTLLMLAAATGARSGELLGLRWSDTEFDDGTGKNRGRVSIRRSLTWGRGDKETGEPRFYPPKTASGTRTIPIPREVVIALKAWKLRCPPSRASIFEDLVFPTADGRPQRRSTVYTVGLDPALRRARLRHVRFHSFASTLIMHGAPVTEVQRLLGHRNPAVTLQIYSHWLKDADSGSTDRLADAYFGSGHKLDTSAVNNS